MPDPLGELPDLAVAQQQLLLQIGALELLARLAQRQRQQILLHQRLIERRLHGELALDLLQADLLAGPEHEHPLHQILQLVQVVRPRVVAQPILCRDAESAQRQVLIVDQPLDVITQEIRHVLGVIAQRRHPQDEHVQVRDQIAPERLVARSAARSLRCAEDRSSAH